MKNWIKTERKIRDRLVRGLLDLIILICLKEIPLSGYDIISSIHDLFGILLSPGTVYPRLRFLENLGLIERIEREEKRIFRVTSKGNELVNLLSTEYSTFYQKLLAIISHYRK